MTCATSNPPKILAGPPCRQCGGATHILSITPHKRVKRRQVWTVQCTSCGEVRDVERLGPRRLH